MLEAAPAGVIVVLAIVLVVTVLVKVLLVFEVIMFYGTFGCSY